MWIWVVALLVAGVLVVLALQGWDVHRRKLEQKAIVARNLRIRALCLPPAKSHPHRHHYHFVLDGQRVAEIEISLGPDPAVLRIEKIEVERAFAGQKIGTFVVGWVIAQFGRCIDTGFEWDSAVGFWTKMRCRFAGKFLPPHTSHDFHGTLKNSRSSS